MTTIVAVSSHLQETVPIESLRDDLDLTGRQVRFLRRYFGLADVCRTNESEVDLLLATVGKLAPFAAARKRIRYVVHAKTVPISAPYPISAVAEICSKLGLDHATAFTLTEHACASGLLAVDLCGTLLAADGDPTALALILVGEKTFTPATQMIPGVAIMGEGVAAVLVATAGTTDRLLGYATRTHSDADGTVIMTSDQADEFRRIYSDGLAEVVHAALAEARLSVSDVTVVLPHNVNHMSWIRAARDIGVPFERVFLDNVGRTGHCFCADPFINHRTVTESGRLRPGDVYVMTSDGLGVTFSAMVFQH